jgi:hypothetical protein
VNASGRSQDLVLLVDIVCGPNPSGFQRLCGGSGRLRRPSRREGQTEGLPGRTGVAAPARPRIPSTLAAHRQRFPGHHGMEEVRGSSPLSSTVQILVRRPFVAMLEALWLVGQASAYQSAYQCARALVVGEESIHCGRSAGQHRT